MVSTFRRELWLTKNDAKLYKIDRVAKSITEPTDPVFTLGVTEPVFYIEPGMPANDGTHAPPIAASTDPGVAGIRPGVTRTNYSGTINWSTPQTISNVNLTGAAAASMQAITGADHTISNFYLQGTDQGTSTATGGLINTKASSCARLRFEYGTIRNAYPNDRLDGFYGHDFTAYRCLVERTVDCFAPNNPFSANTNVNIEGCWGGHQAWFNDDRGTHADGTHNDWSQHHSGLYYNVTGCTLWSYKYNVLNPTNNLAGTTPLAYGGLPPGYTPHANGSNRWPQSGQGILDNTVAYFHNGFAVYSNLWIYGGDTPIALKSLCGITGHNHHYAINQQIHDVTFMNDDQRDYGGSLHYYMIRTDSLAKFNDVGPNYWATTGANNIPEAWNIRYANSSSANQKFDVDPTRRGLSVKVRCDPATLP